MSKPTLLLRHGTQKLDLNDQAHYWLAPDFVPPATIYAAQFAEGIFTNRKEGGNLVSKRAVNRTLTFTVRLAGSSAGDIAQATRAIQAMLGFAGDISEPLYVEYNANSSVPEPLWGQFGANLRYEVADGSLTLGDGYMVGVRRAEDVNVALNLTLKPYALGKRQRLCSASGGVAEDTIGTVDGRSRGLIIPEAVTNKMTNPVFGEAGWSSGWTAGANLVAEQNTAESWLLPGTLNSARLTAINSVYNEWSQAINAGNTNKHSLSCYAKLQDGGAISATQVVLWYDFARATTYTPVGNGWYRLSAENINGINANTQTGVLVSSGYTVFVTGFQLEERTYCTPLAYGDMLGCVWTGTVHASTSTRTAAVCKVPIAADTIALNQGSARLVVRWDVPNTHPNTMLLLDLRDGSNLNALQAYFNPADDKIYFSENAGGTQAITAALTFTARTVVVLHLTWGPGGLHVYVNTVDASTAGHLYYASGVSAFIGSAYTGGYQIVGAVLGAAFFDVPLTAAQVLADYNDIAPVVANGLRVEPAPWLWTKDGDNIVDNCDDATHDNWCVAGGITGSAAAKTEMKLLLDPTATTLYMARMDTREFLNPSWFRDDLSGTADATACGGEYEADTVTTSTTMIVYAPSFALNRLRDLMGREFTLFARMKDAGSDLRMQLDVAGLTTDWMTPYLMNAAFSIVRGPRAILTDSRALPISEVTSSFGYLVNLKRTTGTGSVGTDFVMMVPSPLLKITPAAGTFYYAGEFMPKVAITSTLGDTIELLPERVNTLITFITNVNSAPIANTLAYTYINITPRWSLL